MSVAELEAAEVALESPTGGLWRDAFSRLRRNPTAILGAFLVLLFVIAAAFAPLLGHGNPDKQNLILIAGGCCPGPSHAPLRCNASPRVVLGRARSLRLRTLPAS